MQSCATCVNASVHVAREIERENGSPCVLVYATQFNATRSGRRSVTSVSEIHELPREVSRECQEK